MVLVLLMGWNNTLSSLTGLVILPPVADSVLLTGAPRVPGPVWLPGRVSAGAGQLPHPEPGEDQRGCEQRAGRGDARPRPQHHARLVPAPAPAAQLIQPLRPAPAPPQASPHGDPGAAPRPRPPPPAAADLHQRPGQRRAARHLQAGGCEAGARGEASHLPRPRPGLSADNLTQRAGPQVSPHTHCQCQITFKMTILLPHSNSSTLASK